MAHYLEGTPEQKAASDRAARIQSWRGGVSPQYPAGQTPPTNAPGNAAQLDESGTKGSQGKQ